MIICSNKSCTNKTRCTRYARKSGYCKEHDDHTAFGFGVNPHWGDGSNWMAPKITENSVDWLGTETRLR